jgi:protein polybromo-1
VISAADMQHLNTQNLGVEDDVELMKTAKYYEQLVINAEIYKIGDHVYVNNATQFVQTQSKLPLIVRIDRLWSIETPTGKKYYLRGPLFLRAIDIDHEPTRLFYTNEVMREQSRDITASLLEQVVSATSSGSKKCVVMSNKKYATSRLTEIDERDVYVCEAKYSMHTKTFRKFTKYGIRKIELSVKCMEDEVYFLRRELQLRKNLSPLLVNMTIVYEDEGGEQGLNEQNFDNGNVIIYFRIFIIYKYFGDR